MYVSKLEPLVTVLHPIMIWKVSYQQSVSTLQTCVQTQLYFRILAVLLMLLQTVMIHVKLTYF